MHPSDPPALSRRAFLAAGALTLTGAAAADDPLAGPFRWRLGPPLVAPARRPDDLCHAIKDPSVVFHGGRWHLFCTIRSARRTHQIEYLSFADWPQADAAPRQVLTLTDGYFCAPQVFFFTPQKRWYLIHQVGDPDRRPQLQPAFSAATDLADPAAWSKPALLFSRSPENVRQWIDFWVICDDTHARLFFTSLDGQMWRADARLADFPHGWDRPRVVLRGDIFEASHTYRVRGGDRFFTVVEAQGPGGRRYYKAYRADRLDGDWRPVADTLQGPFAGPANVRAGGPSWTDSISHGELLRAGPDERLEIDPANLRFLFQGVADTDRQGKPYGAIPWRLGLLERA
jgi:hypothetical protein